VAGAEGVAAGAGGEGEVDGAGELGCGLVSTDDVDVESCVPMFDALVLPSGGPAPVLFGWASPPPGAGESPPLGAPTPPPAVCPPSPEAGAGDPELAGCDCAASGCVACGCVGSDCVGCDCVGCGCAGALLAEVIAAPPVEALGDVLAAPPDAPPPCLTARQRLGPARRAPLAPRSALALTK
jgi:hypothetical protein